MFQAQAPVPQSRTICQLPPGARIQNLYSGVVQPAADCCEGHGYARRAAAMATLVVTLTDVQAGGDDSVNGVSLAVSQLALLPTARAHTEIVYVPARLPAVFQVQAPVPQSRTISQLPPGRQDPEPVLGRGAAGCRRREGYRHSW